MNCHANKSIECTVKQCAHHCEDANFCSLEKILVGTHEANPTVDQCTDCMSFRKKLFSAVAQPPHSFFVLTDRQNMFMI